MTKSSQLLGGAVGRLHYHAARFAGDVCRPKSGEVKTHIAKQGQKWPTLFSSKQKVEIPFSKENFKEREARFWQW